MLLRARKILEVLCFLIVCATTFLLWFVSLPRWGKYLCLLIGGVLPGLGGIRLEQPKTLGDTETDSQLQTNLRDSVCSGVVCAGYSGGGDLP